jgi:hypothetical protein
MAFPIFSFSIIFHIKECNGFPKVPVYWLKLPKLSLFFLLSTQYYSSVYSHAIMKGFLGLSNIKSSQVSFFLVLGAFVTLFIFISSIRFIYFHFHVLLFSFSCGAMRVECRVCLETEKKMGQSRKLRIRTNANLLLATSYKCKM